MRDFGKTVVENPLLAMAIVELYKAGRFGKDLFREALQSPDLAMKIVRHETMHSIMKELDQ